jgi:hypothetical protein
MLLSFWDAQRTDSTLFPTLKIIIIESNSQLKIVFSDIFKETEVDSIKRHLKDDELMGESN